MSNFHARGFTLLEILIAMVILALMTTMAYRGLSSVLQSRDHLVSENKKWRGIALAFTRIENDLSQVANRPARQASAAQRLPFYASAQAGQSNELLLSFTRLGHGEQSNQLAGPIRSGYRLRENTLEQLVWSNPDADTRHPPYATPILHDVTRLVLRYLDYEGSWHANWPLANNNQALPAAVEITVELNSGERIARIFDLPQTL